MGFENIFEFVYAAGIVAWPLITFSLVGLALIIERLYFWYRINRRQLKVVRDILRTYQAEPSLAIKKLKQNADLPICRIFIDALALDHPTPEEFRLALESAAQAELPTLKRFNTIFDTIVTASPLLGLLGTVLGLMASFASLKLGDIGGTRTAGVASGIAEALASTALGLIVALFVLLFANAFRAFYQRQTAYIQEYGGQLELLYRHQYEEKTKGRKYAST